MRLFTNYEFDYKVSKSLLKMDIATNALSVVATLISLGDGLDPLITISFSNISVLDILNISDWSLVKRECEELARIHFDTNANVIVPANSQLPHYNMPTN